MQHPRRHIAINWTEQAANILKIELIKKNMTYTQLAEHLQAIGIDESDSTIRQKIFRGTFQLSFFLQCIVVLDIKTLKFDELIEKALAKPATKKKA